MTTNLIDQELELDDSSVALVLTVALHPCTAKAKKVCSVKENWKGARKVHAEIEENLF